MKSTLCTRLGNAVWTRASTVEMILGLSAHQARSSKTIILPATPIHGNLGDQAIVLAQTHFLMDAGLHGLFECNRWQYERGKNAIGHLVRPGDLVIIDGGGNIGSLWPAESDKMNDIVVRFQENPVVVFPQTAYFEDTVAGEDCRRRVSEAYAKNPNLLFFSRDRATYDAIREIAPTTRNLYVPDIVLYLDESHRDYLRSGALLCLRSDKERVTGDGAALALRSALKARGLAAHETDTVVDLGTFGRITTRNREAVLDAKWDEFASAEVVVTDRLHGMLFSAITGTPCVALDNVSHKVSQGYEWIRHLPYVRVASCIEEVPQLLDEVLDAGPQAYDRSPLEPEFMTMRREILALI